MEITIKIQAPELAHAIETLAIAIGCTVDKIGVGEAIKEAVDQGPAEVTNKPGKGTKDTEKVTKEPEKEPEKETKQEETESEDAKATEADIRAKFVELSKKGKKSELKDILAKLGVSKVSDLKADQFNEAMNLLEAI